MHKLGVLKKLVQRLLAEADLLQRRHRAQTRRSHEPPVVREQVVALVQPRDLLLHAGDDVGVVLQERARAVDRGLHKAVTERVDDRSAVVRVRKRVVVVVAVPQQTQQEADRVRVCHAERVAHVRHRRRGALLRKVLGAGREHGRLGDRYPAIPQRQAVHHAVLGAGRVGGDDAKAVPLDVVREQEAPTEPVELARVARGQRSRGLRPHNVVLAPVGHAAQERQRGQLGGELAQGGDGLVLRDHVVVGKQLVPPAVVGLNDDDHANPRKLRVGANPEDGRVAQVVDLEHLPLRKRAQVVDRLLVVDRVVLAQPLGLGPIRELVRVVDVVDADYVVVHVLGLVNAQRERAHEWRHGWGRVRVRDEALVHGGVALAELDLDRVALAVVVVVDGEDRAAGAEDELVGDGRDLGLLVADLAQLLEERMRRHHRVVLVFQRRDDDLAHGLVHQRAADDALEHVHDERALEPHELAATLAERAQGRRRPLQRLGVDVERAHAVVFDLELVPHFVLPEHHALAVPRDVHRERVDEPRVGRGLREEQRAEPLARHGHRQDAAQRDGLVDLARVVQQLGREHDQPGRGRDDVLRRVLDKHDRARRERLRLPEVLLKAVARGLHRALQRRERVA
eukprot:Unigene10219_Nuclearia_a/m.31213 Unigene10219_Nuclearia_a/g.31213  ORF Unigene10219_Nuclearia_a/g.31213 Unigene10219_Nuclearia_a/m.31213 type:complete len:624 (-) Unigene10219_Nuclearia_a:795-2666(-)